MQATPTPLDPYEPIGLGLWYVWRPHDHERAQRAHQLGSEHTGGDQIAQATNCSGFFTVREDPIDVSVVEVRKQIQPLSTGPI
jgi:hypothetical protein